MTDAPGPGWYPDPYGSGGLRWWDGVRWTEHASPAPMTAGPTPYAPQQRRELPEGTSVYTVWIWLVATLPLVSSLLLFVLQPHAAFHQVSIGGRSTMMVDPFALLGGPAYFLVTGFGSLLSAALIVFSWLDYRELVRRGVERPFHWAWSFLGVIVYSIGRSVIVRRVARGRGMAVLWVAIGVCVLTGVIAIAWSVLLVAQILGTVSSQVPYGA